MHRSLLASVFEEDTRSIRAFDNNFLSSSVLIVRNLSSKLTYNAFDNGKKNVASISVWCLRTISPGVGHGRRSSKVSSANCFLLPLYRDSTPI